jgi:DNA-binding transcriptional MerR regulator
MEEIDWEEKVNKLRGELIYQHIEGKVRWSVEASVKFFGLPSSRLRFWEEEFPFKVNKSMVRGDRYYTFSDMNLIIEIIRLLEVECYTIKGARRQLIKNPLYSRQILKKP